MSDNTSKPWSRLEILIPALVLCVLVAQVALSAAVLFRLNQLAGAVKALQERPRRGAAAPDVIVPDVSADDDPARGPADAPVTIVEFSDFECPSCAYAEQIVSRALSEYGPRVRLVYRDFPLPIHARATAAAVAAECAHRQGKFWEMHARLFAQQEALAPENLLQHARQIGLDGTAFGACLESPEAADEVRHDQAEGVKYGVEGTPTFFVNGRMLVGAPPYESFREKIEAALAAAAGRNDEGGHK